MTVGTVSTVIGTITRTGRGHTPLTVGRGDHMHHHHPFAALPHIENPLQQVDRRAADLEADIAHSPLTMLSPLH